MEIAENDKGLLIEEAKLKAIAMKEHVLNESRKKYDKALEEFFNTNTDEELEIIQKANQDIKELKKKELKNLEKTADIIFEDFVRYIDVKSEENE